MKWCREVAELHITNSLFPFFLFPLFSHNNKDNHLSDVTTMFAMDHWVKSAMADDTVVAELLHRLKYSSSSLSTISPPLFSQWGAKQQRSTASARKKMKEDERFSPTTPLSWTTSADCCEESRSKATASGEGNSTSTKNCKRKKTFAELIQEETSLFKEGIYLREEIENKKVSFQAGRASNESLKRRKLDLGSISGDKPNSSADELLSTLPDQHESRIVPSTSSAITNGNEDDTHPRVARTEIPDLNMMPYEEEDSYADIPCGMS